MAGAEEGSSTKTTPTKLLHVQLTTSVSLAESQSGDISQQKPSGWGTQKHWAIFGPYLTLKEKMRNGKAGFLPKEQQC